jgi:starch-binding outer membrane protein, SusD/RagB family
MGMFMKKLLLLLFIALAIAPACNFLDENSPNDVNVEGAIKDAASAEAALIGVYSALQNSDYYGGLFPLMTEPLCNNAATGGYDFIDLDQLGQKTLTADNLYAAQFWVAAYRVIANCNYLIEALSSLNDPQLSEERRQVMTGQARAIRALAHFDLLRTYGEHWNTNSSKGIPIIRTIQTIEDKPARATVREVYNFIESELISARSQSDFSLELPQYVNYATCSGLLARVCLYSGKLEQAETFAVDALVNTVFEFSLLPADQYTNVFDNRQTSESIFELKFDPQNRSDFNGLTYARADALRPEVNFMAHQDLDAFFAARSGDVRATLVDFNADNNDASIQPDGRSQKYRGEDAKDNPAYLLRAAELYLIRAEAQGYPAGLIPLNALRTQRGLPELSASEVPDLSSFVTAVLNERRAELNFEGHYYYDLARTRRFAEATGADAHLQIFPIPNREIQATDGALTQNEGY